ncbi:MAG: tRNA pseudouridine(13) synthase TruD, partial [Caldilineaceae bacterium]|nr:tRNA pseudouridine(13) synthase TruD [Caldilineaceae bacterium]
MLKSETNLSLPFITALLPGIGGEIRATPEEFVVEEIPLYDPCGEGQHLYVSLTKVGATTRELQAQLARLFGISVGNVGFAGMKDKHARTTQTFSLNVGHQPSGF